jgi:general secretion pathway protein C
MTKVKTEKVKFNTFIFSIFNIIFAAFLGYWFITKILYINNPLEIKHTTLLKNEIVSYNQFNYPPSALNISSLLNNKLFGKPIKIKKKDTIKEIIVAPETKLKLTLLGTLISDHKLSAKAIILDSNNKSKSYHIGDSLSGGGLLHAIYADHVILQRNNEYETLHLVGKKKSNRLTKKSNSNNKLETYRQQIINNPAKMADLIKIQIAKQDGNFIGYKINAGRNKEVLAEFGLQKNDIITSINNINLNSPLKGLTALQKLTTAKKLDLEILRDGNPIYLNFMIKN